MKICVCVGGCICTRAIPFEGQTSTYLRHVCYAFLQVYQTALQRNLSQSVFLLAAYGCTCLPPPHHLCLFLVLNLYPCVGKILHCTFIHLAAGETEHLFKRLWTLCNSPSQVFICFHFLFFFWIIGLILMNLSAILKVCDTKTTAAIVAHSAGSLCLAVACEACIIQPLHISTLFFSFSTNLTFLLTQSEGEKICIIVVFQMKKIRFSEVWKWQETSVLSDDTKTLCSFHQTILSSEKPLLTWQHKLASLP